MYEARGRIAELESKLAAEREARGIDTNRLLCALAAERERREAAGMPHVRFHDLRHTTASWLINSGVDLYTVGKILGHSGPQTTARYAHLSTATLEQAMRKLR